MDLCQLEIMVTLLRLHALLLFIALNMAHQSVDQGLVRIAHHRGQLEEIEGSSQIPAFLGVEQVWDSLVIIQFDFVYDSHGISVSGYVVLPYLFQGVILVEKDGGYARQKYGTYLGGQFLIDHEL